MGWRGGGKWEGGGGVAETRFPYLVATMHGSVTSKIYLIRVSMQQFGSLGWFECLSGAP